MLTRNKEMNRNSTGIQRPFVEWMSPLTPNPFYNLYAYRNFPSDPIPWEERRFYAHVFVQMQEMRPPVPGNPLLQGVRGREEEVPEVREPQRRADPRDVFRQDIEESVDP